MSSEEIKERKDVNPKDKWNVESIYPTNESFSKEFEKYKDLKEVEVIESFRGKLSKIKAKELCEIYEKYYDLERIISKMYVYSSLRKDENLSDEENKSNYKKVRELYNDFVTRTSWLDPELVSMPEEKIKEFEEAEDMEKFRLDFQRTVRMKPHTRSEDIEEIISQSYKMHGGVYSSLCDNDLTYGTVKDGEGKDRVLTHANFYTYIKDQDRVLRKNAFVDYHKKYKDFQNTIAELLNMQAQKHWFYSKVKGYKSCLEGSVFRHNIDKAVYSNLIEATHEGITALHSYVEMRKNILDYKDGLHLYDLYVPLLKGGGGDKKYSFDEGVEMTIKGAAPLGKEYQEKLEKGLKVERWADRYENKGKRSGGHPDTFPFILLNFKGNLENVFTMTHEGGHSMHSKLSSDNNPYHYSQYALFVAEVASIFNECNLHSHLMKKAVEEKDEKRQLYLLNKQIENIRTTFFRQVLFAEFELFFHECVEQKKPITPELMNNKFVELYKFYYGEDHITIDKDIEIEWARIPHFFLYRYYVYQYATGISAAVSLSERVRNGGEEEKKRYLNFLKGGCSKWPLDLLKDAGIDLTTKEPFLDLIGVFKKLVKEFQELYFKVMKKE